MGTGVTHTSFVNGLLPRWVFCRSIYFIFHFPACSFPFFWIAAIKADIRSPAAGLPDSRQSQEAHSSSSLIFVICTASSQSPKATFPAAVHAARVYSGVCRSNIQSSGFLSSDLSEIPPAFFTYHKSQRVQSARSIPYPIPRPFHFTTLSFMDQSA